MHQGDDFRAAYVTCISNGFLNIDIAYPLGGNVHRILLQNEPIFTKCQENTHNKGK